MQKFSFFVVLVFVAFLQLVSAAPYLGGIAATNSYLRDAYFTNITFRGFIHRGQEPVVLTGTMDSIMAEVLHRNPNYYIDFPAATVADVGLQKRTITKTICDNFPQAEGDVFVQEALPYLNGLQGDCSMPGRADGGPAACGRISCSYDAAVGWCVDAPHEVVIKCNLMGAFLKHLLEQKDCGHDYWEGVQQKFRISGQVFDDGGFNMIAYREGC